MKSVFIMLSRSCLFVGVLTLTNWTLVQAAPLGHIYLEGRKQGTTDWVRNMFVAPGDVIEYRIQVDLAPVGASNVQGPMLNVITAASTNANSGFNSLSLQIKQDASTPIQVSFDPPLSAPNSLASFRNGWADGTGASSGTPTPRPGGNGNDLVGVRPVHAPGVFTGFDPQVVMSLSTFRVTRSPAGGFGVLTPSWGTLSGALRINGVSHVFITADVQNSADPIVGFHGLTFIPEPATIVLGGSGLAAVLIVVRRRRITASRTGLP